MVASLTPYTFAKATPAASFRRGDTVWLVFDSKQPLELRQLRVKCLFLALLRGEVEWRVAAASRNQQ